MGQLGFAAVSSTTKQSAALHAFCAHMDRTAGLALVACPVGSTRDLVSGTVEGRFDVLWAPPLVAIELEEREAATPLVVIERQKRSGYFAALFARSDAGLHRIEDLRDATVAWVSRESASGYFVPRWHLRRLGIDLSRAFAREVYCSTHEGVARAVLTGEADVGACYVGIEPSTNQLESAPWIAIGREPSDMRVLMLVGPVPADVVAGSRRLRSSTRQRLTGAFLSIVPETALPARELFQATRFDPFARGHFALLRELMRYQAE